MPDNPVVFLSHASEDKARFVVAFAEKLRANGVDVWLDKWEILPGDSLVDKIFEEGLKNAAAVIVVISTSSVGKPWVREELNVGVVKRIEKGTRLIPVIIDDVPIPEALTNTVWERIADLTSYEPELARVVAAIFGVRSKPPLGPVPAFAQSEVGIAGLQKQDVAVLRLFCDAALEQDHMFSVQTEPTAIAAATLGIAREQFLESAAILAEHYFLEKARVMAPVPPYYSVTLQGLDQYFDAFVPDYRGTCAAIVSLIVNEAKRSAREIADALGHPKLVTVEHVLDVLSNNGLVQISKVSPRHTSVSDVSPRLRRVLEGGG